MRVRYVCCRPFDRFPVLEPERLPAELTPAAREQIVQWYAERWPELRRLRKIAHMRFPWAPISAADRAILLDSWRVCDITGSHRAWCALRGRPFPRASWS